MDGSILAIICGGIGAAAINGAMALIKYKISRRDAKKDKTEDKKEQQEIEWAAVLEAHKKALRYIMLRMMEQMCKDYITAGGLTMDARRMLHHWHELYQKGLGGNGDLNDLLAQVDELPIKLE